MVRHTLKILEQMSQGLYSMSDHVGTLCIKGLKVKSFSRSWAVLEPDKVVFNFSSYIGYLYIGFR